MSNQYFIFHPHQTPEENKKIKYHIVSDNNIELKTLCGIDTTEKLLDFSCSGDAITMEWYEDNLKYDNGRTTCKKCAAKLLKLLKENV